MARRLAAIGLLIAVALSLQAEVFTLWPSRGGGGRGRPSGAPGLLNPLEIMNEPVIVNGTALRLDVALIHDTLERCVLQLRSAYPDGRFDRNQDAVRVTIPDGKKYFRLLLVKLGPELPVMQFSMELPAGFPGQIEWPAELPITADGKPLESVYYPKRRTWYGSFTTTQRPQAAVAELANKLSGAGWEPMSGSELTQAPSGLMMVRKAPPGIMVMNFSESGHGSIMLQELK